MSTNWPDFPPLEKPEGITEHEWAWYQNSDPSRKPELRDKIEAALGWKKDDVEAAREIAEQVLGAVKIAEKGHVPEEFLNRYRNLARIASRLDSLGDQVGGRGQYEDANTLWALSAKYKHMANELRADLPAEKREEEQ